MFRFIPFLLPCRIEGMADRDIFRELYEKLNPEQREAVDSVEGPVMVVAGPGTGKTQVLTLRIANILRKTQINPGNVLALTFTESGAGEMRERLNRIIGVPAYSVGLFTFHGFCNDLILSYPDAFPGLVHRKPLDEISQVRILEEVITTSSLSLLRPFGSPFYYLRDVRRALSELKREGIAPDVFHRLVSEEEKHFSEIEDVYYDSGRYQGKMRGKYADLYKRLQKNKELAELYGEYQKKLEHAGFYDYDDMILEVLSALERDQEFLLRLQERFHYFLVDEHQDTNNAQNKVLELLCNFFDNPNIFVVGDEKQAIFRFQGASLENFLYFKKLYPSAKLIALTRNYRSPQTVLDFASGIMQNNAAHVSSVLPEIEERLEAQMKEKRAGVTLFSFSRPDTELYFVGRKIRELIEEGALPQEIAVLYRDNYDAFSLIDMFEKQGIPFRVESRRNVLDDPDIQKLILLLRFLADVHSEETLANLLHVDFLNIPSLDLYKVMAGRRRRSLFESIIDDGTLDRCGVEHREVFRETGAKLMRWKRELHNRSFDEVFEMIIRESGFLAAILAKPDSTVRLGRLERVFREVKNLVRNHPGFSLHDFLQYLDVISEYGSTLKEQPSSFVPRAVRMMTAHGAKGREFDYVFVVNAHDGHWGNRRTRELIRLPSSVVGERVSRYEHNDDERRLFYVAVTRARKDVFISYAKSDEKGKAQLPSQFLGEVLPHLREEGDSKAYENSFEDEKQLLFEERVRTPWSVFEVEYLRHLFLKRGFSATALNNFLSCPWKYFYVNLLRIPRAPSRHQRYGRAIHAALKDFFDALQSGKSSPEFLLQRFADALRGEGLSERDLTEMLERGRKTLAAYVEQYRGSWHTNTRNEYRVEKVFLPIPHVKEPLRLTGLVDKIEFSKEDINVVDYKTGKPRSRNELEGKTKRATGDYERQLVFYKLILDAYPPFPHTVQTGEIDFVEPDPRGKFRKERFVVTENQVEKLRDLILDTAQSIISLSFWDKRCGDEECEFCALRNMIEK